MIGLLKGAEASLFLSWYEGFGLPVLESQACGTPVVCSNKASLPEVAGNAALMASPDDTRKILDYLMQIKNTSIGSELAKKGLSNYQRYSWKKAAQNVVTELCCFK